MTWDRFHEPFEHAVVITFEKAPRFARGFASCETLDHPFRMHTAIHIITKENDVCVRAAVGFYQSKCVFQHLELAVNVANGVNGLCHGDSPNAERPP